MLPLMLGSVLLGNRSPWQAIHKKLSLVIELEISARTLEEIFVLET